MPLHWEKFITFVGKFVVKNITISITAMIEEDRIIKIDIENEMKSAYIDYSMSVIVSRALPDVRDGLKPVHRRVLFGMNEMGNTSDKPHKKSARSIWLTAGQLLFSLANVHIILCCRFPAIHVTLPIDNNSHSESLFT